LFNKIIIDIAQAFSSMTIPPIIKTVKRNGRTLIYRVQDTAMDQEIAPQSQPVVSHHDHHSKTFANPTISSAWHFSFKETCSTCAW
jgi:hypothetical protein